MKFKKLTFRGGTHIRDFKELSCNTKIVHMPVPELITISMSQHIGKPAKCIVKKKEIVKMGQLIGEADGFVSANIHSSVSGEVVDIKTFTGSNGQPVQAVVIKNDGLDEKIYTKPEYIEKPSKEYILNAVKNAGIVGMGGAGFPTHVKLSIPDGKKVEYFLVNAAECEPYLTCDDLAMNTYPAKIVRGLQLAMIATDCEKGIICIEDNKPKAIESILKETEQLSNIEVRVLKTKYPQGDEKQLIFASLGRQVPQGKLPLDVGVVVDNLGTLASICDAVDEGKPLIERVVTITGHAIKNPSNLLVRFGTSIKECIDFTGGYVEEPGKIIFGGPMMGVAQYSDTYSTDKRNNAILALTKEETKSHEIEACMRCGRCVDICPMQLEPLYIATASKMELYDVAKDYHIMTCVECGCCSYICPSHRPLTEFIRFGKREIRKRG